MASSSSRMSSPPAQRHMGGLDEGGRVGGQCSLTGVRPDGHRRQSRFALSAPGQAVAHQLGRLLKRQVVPTTRAGFVSSSSGRICGL
jgi:hypothetical protein